jgi:hypothetical protein
MNHADTPRKTGTTAKSTHAAMRGLAPHRPLSGIGTPSDEAKVSGPGPIPGRTLMKGEDQDYDENDNVEGDHDKRRDL